MREQVRLHSAANGVLQESKNDTGCASQRAGNPDYAKRSQAYTVLCMSAALNAKNERVGSASSSASAAFVGAGPRARLGGARW